MSNNYLLYGSEKYLINEKIDQLILCLEDEVGEKAELIMLDGFETNASLLEHHLTYNSLFALSKILIIKEPLWFKKAGRKTGQYKEIFEVLQAYFAEDNPNQTLIVTNNELTYEDIKAKGFAKNDFLQLFVNNAQAIEFNPDKGELRKWLIENLKAKGLKASDEAIKLLLNSGQDMYYLDNLLEKYALAQIINITPQILADEIEVIYEIKIFKLTDALLNRNRKAALAAFYKLIDQGLAYTDIIPMINFQFTALAQVKAGEENHQDATIIAKETKLNPYVIKNMHKNTRNFSWEELWEIFKLLLELDLQMKTTSLNKGVLVEIFIMQVCK